MIYYANVYYQYFFPFVDVFVKIAIIDAANYCYIPYMVCTIGSVIYICRDVVIMLIRIMGNSQKHK